MVATGIPEGFEPQSRRSPLTDPWEPIYSKQTPDAIILGLRLATPHTNARGFVHGGLIAALADKAMGHSCGHRWAAPIRW
jgi:acyl-coenzyme A thioesterase PaaI-like protein